MKKIICLLMSIVLVIGLAACKSNETNNDSNIDSGVQEIVDEIKDEVEENIEEIVEDVDEDFVDEMSAQRDDSAMGGVANALLMALSDQQVFDTVMMYSCNGNVGYYVSVEDGEVAAVDGTVRGMTVTFQPEDIGGKRVFNLYNGIINKFVRNDGAKYINKDTVKIAEGRNTIAVKYVVSDPDYTTNGLFGTMAQESGGFAHLYNRVSIAVGENIEITSSKYANSEYTIFVSMGQPVSVKGAWNGANIEAEIE